MNQSRAVATFLIVMAGITSTAWSEVTFTVSVADPNGDGTGYIDDLERCLLAAASEWSSSFDGNAAIEIELSFDRVANVLMYAGAYTSVYQYTSEGYMVYDWCTSQELQDGFDVNGKTPDATVTVNPDFFNDFYFDPDPRPGAASVPPSKYDAYSVFLHELGHAFAFNGWLEQDGAGAGLPAFDENGNPVPPGRPQRIYVVDDQKRLCCSKATGHTAALLTPPANYISVYDTFVEDGAGTVKFVGAQAQEIQTGGIPLDPESYSHTLDPTTVMHTYAYPGIRGSLSNVELAIAEDCGLPIVPDAASISDGGLTDPGDSDCISDLDTDGDGVDDCADECPFDATRTEQGECGCVDCVVDDTDADADTDAADVADDDPSDDEVLSDIPEGPPAPACGAAPLMIPLMLLMVVVIRAATRWR